MIRQKTSARSRTDEFIEVVHCDEIYRVALKRVRGARRFTLRIRAANRDVVLSMPYRGKLGEARHFAESHAAWIGARLSRLPDPVPFANGSKIPLRGLDHTIIHLGPVRGVVWTGTTENVSGGEERAIFVAGDDAHVSRRIHDYLKQQAKDDLTHAVMRHAQQIGVAPRRVSLRDTSSRWGSCSSSGTLNFSWRLILAPEYVLDYLAAHEVAHLRYLDHSPKFWKLTKELCPLTDRAEAWLNANGAQLHRYGKTA